MQAGDAPDRRDRARPDRRRFPRGGRRPSDRAGFHPLVLVVDEDPSGRDLCEMVLARLRFAVAHGRNADEAIRIVAALRPNLVLCGLPLDGPGGAALMRELQIDGFARQIPVIVISNVPRETGWPRAEQLGARGYLVRPFEPDALVEEVRRVLRATTSR